MAEVRVVIVYSDELVSIKVNEENMNVRAIQKKTIEDWFVASNDRSGWEGLIAEIKRKVGNEHAKISFEFVGPREKKRRFEECLNSYGYGSADGLSEKEIALRKMKEALNAEYRGDYKDAFECYKEAALCGNLVEAQYKVAEYYWACNENDFDGIEIEKEAAGNKAIEYYIKAAEQGHAEAQFFLYRYFYTEEDSDEKSKAMQWLIMAAEQGCVEAQCELGCCYILGTGVEENIEKAMMWLEKASEDGRVEAQYCLGVCYEKIGNEDNAVRWYKSAAIGGYDDAQYALGNCYYFGRGIEENEEEAVKWYGEAAAQGNVEAQHQLGTCYYWGLGIEKNRKKAVEWYRKAADQGNVESQWELGEYYYDKYEHLSLFEYGDEKEFIEDFIDNEDETFFEDSFDAKKEAEDAIKEAVKWYKKVADQGHAEALYKLGECYEQGEGVEENIEEAIIWYKKAAEHDNFDAMNHLGECYELSDKISTNLEEAFFWYKKAAEHDLAEGEYNTGRFYYFGKGIEKNYYIAVDWFEKAANHNDEKSQYMLGQCYEKGTGVEKNMEIAIEWYRKAARGSKDFFDELDKDNFFSNPEACYRLGQCYENGTGVDKNTELAFEWYKKAADNWEPNPEACYKVAETYYKKIDPKSAVRTGAIMAVSVLVPVTNIVTVPVGILGAAKTRSSKFKKFLETDTGKDMVEYYRKAAESGHEDAKKKLKKIEGYL